MSRYMNPVSVRDNAFEEVSGWPRNQKKTFTKATTSSTYRLKSERLSGSAFPWRLKRSPGLIWMRFSNLRSRVGKSANNLIPLWMTFLWRLISDSGCSTEVKRRRHNIEVVGLTPAGCGAFFPSCVSNFSFIPPKRSPLVGGATSAIKNGSLAELPGAKTGSNKRVQK